MRTLKNSSGFAGARCARAIDGRAPCAPALLAGQMRELRHQEARTAQTVKQVVVEREALGAADSLTGEAAATEAAASHRGDFDGHGPLAGTNRSPHACQQRSPPSKGGRRSTRGAMNRRLRWPASTHRRHVSAASLRRSSGRSRRRRTAATGKRGACGEAAGLGRPAGVQQPGEEELAQLGRAKELRRESRSRRRGATLKSASSKRRTTSS
jgi:hypothetical protein